MYLCLMNVGALQPLKEIRTIQHKFFYQNNSQRKSNLGFILLCSDAPTIVRPCQSITIVHFQHPPIISKSFPFIFLTILKLYRKPKYIGHNFFYHISKLMRLLEDQFHLEMHMDGNMFKQFQQILVHTFQTIDLHHLQPFFNFS